MKPAGANIDFLLDPGIVPAIDLANDYRNAPKLILNLITSNFSANSFYYPKAKPGNVHGLACNPYPTPKGNIEVCLYVLRERSENGWLQCGIMTWLLPHYHIFRPWYKPDQIDFQFVASFKMKLEAILVENLGAKDVTLVES
jgi:hypothetical protein